MADVYVGLGANLGNPADNLREAIERLARRIEVVRISSVYRTEPVGMRDQPDFLNAVLAARTEASPRDVLDLLLATEAAMGRQRQGRGGPRLIDLDLLAYDGLSWNEPGLTLPHPRLAMRRFVLVPLAEVAPGLRPAAGGPTVVELLAALPAHASVERVDVPAWPLGPLGRPEV
jgi:2-amino-4-hydroxy-6-hydroxymethyldihydropteridine diphosphokinase